MADLITVSGVMAESHPPGSITGVGPATCEECWQDILVAANETMNHTGPEYRTLCSGCYLNWLKARRRSWYMGLDEEESNDQEGITQ